MDMREMAQIMDEYFETVTEEQFEKDLIEAGILEMKEGKS